MKGLFIKMCEIIFQIFGTTLLEGSKGGQYLLLHLVRREMVQKLLQKFSKSCIDPRASIENDKRANFFKNVGKAQYKMASVASSKA